MKKIVLAASVLIASTAAIQAQNDLQYAHFMVNTLTYNPAVAGSNNNLDIILLGRKQWVGIGQSPLSQTLNAHTYLEKLKGGVGLTLINDKLGYESSLNLKASYAYHIKINKNATLAAGASVGFLYKSLEQSKLIFDDQTDPTAQATSASKIKPDFNVGLEFRNKDLVAGFSTTHIDQGVGSATVYKVPRHYFLYGKYYIGVSKDLDIVPSILFKSAGFVTQFEGNVNVLYQKKYWVGLTYRNKEAAAGLVGMQINNKFKIGYAYDFNMGITKTNHSSGSHELFVNLMLPGFSKKKHSMKTPRFFN
ncbi:MAG: type IX secretion system membrane protein PorP/SprF [Bacteroidia bacterium]